MEGAEGSSDREWSLAPRGFALCSRVLVNSSGVAEISCSVNVLICCVTDG